MNCTVFNDAGLIAIVKWAVGGGSAEKSTISGVLLGLWPNAHVDLAAFSSKLDVVAFRDMLGQYNELRLVVLAFGDRETMDRFVLDHPEVLETTAGPYRYCFAVRTEGSWTQTGEGEDNSAVPASEIKAEIKESSDELEEYDEFHDDTSEERPWKIVEPASLRATGTCHRVRAVCSLICSHQGKVLHRSTRSYQAYSQQQPSRFYARRANRPSVACTASLERRQAVQCSTFISFPLHRAFSARATSRDFCVG